MESKWDHLYLVTLVRGPVITVVNERTGKRKLVNRDKPQVVDALWDGLQL